MEVIGKLPFRLTPHKYNILLLQTKFNLSEKNLQKIYVRSKLEP